MKACKSSFILNVSYILQEYDKIILKIKELIIIMYQKTFRSIHHYDMLELQTISKRQANYLLILINAKLKTHLSLSEKK